MVHLDNALYGVVHTLLPRVFNCHPANAAEPLLACFQVLLNRNVQHSIVLQTSAFNMVCCRQMTGYYNALRA